MNNPASFRTSPGLLLGALLALSAPACGGAVMSGVAVGRVGHGLAAHTDTIPQGVEVCGLKEALASSGSGSDKPLSDACGKAAKKDRLWRGALTALAAYGETLETLASGGNADSAGQIEAARTGIRGSDWIDVDGGDETAARDAAAALVHQMETSSAKGDLARAVKDAAPHVKAICDGLTAYLDAQARALGDVEKEAEHKRASRGDRRCGLLDTRTVCVSESVIDRMLYANVYAEATLLDARHAEARDGVAGFCAAHRKLEEAASAGTLSKDKTFSEIVEAVRVARQHDAAEPAPAGKGKK